ncbi:hypothetical protein SDC9_39302 [bioreactor metagenome]|uniref:PKD domain-containing protein n=1 Tax=bioreactor metagenome TaxID=1076179 RepID=A0A644VP95_9ZZZZ
MKRTLLFLCIALLISFSSAAQTSRPQWQDGKIWIKVRADYPVKKNSPLDGNIENPMNLPLTALQFIQEIAPKYHFTRLSRPFHMAVDFEPLENLYQIDFSDYQNTEMLLKDLSGNPAVEYAERVPVYYCDVVTPNDPYYNTSYAWGLYKINAGNAWDYSTGSSSITVAVVDNAVEITHSDLSPNIWVNTGEIASNGIDDDGNGYIDDRNGYDVADNDNNPNPPSVSFDHGTHVAGTVGARSNNGTGVASIGYSIKIIPVKATADASSPTSVTNGYDGIIYAANSGADVINMSWGGSSYSSTGQSVITYAHNQGCVLVAAAGNDDVNTPHYPSSYNYVISVASTSSTDAKSSFSNYGTDVDVSAPGSYIYSTLPGNTYGYMSGTSMASPLVAGLCGLMLSLNPGLSPEDIETCLENSCDNIDAQNPSYINQLGAGRINAQAAMSCISSTLSWPPVADFEANITTVSAGGTIDFSDASIYNPTSWSWTFSGGLPGTFSGQNPPAITYSTPGTYNVSLTVTNSNGTDTETKAGYITVLSANACDTVTNTQSGDNIYMWTWSGYIGGQNSNQVTRWADKFTNSYPAGTNLHYIDYYFVEGMTNSSTSFITATLWDATGTGGAPGAVVASKNVLLQEIEDNQTPTGFYPTRVVFDNPVALPAGDFFVGFTLTNTAGDTVVLAATQNIYGVAGRANSIWLYNYGGNALWEAFNPTYSSSYAMNFHVYLYATTVPVTADIQPATPSVCTGESVSFSSSGCLNEVSTHWYFNGATIDTTTAANPVVFFNTPGNHTQYLVAYNTCGYYNIDSTVVSVYATPVVNVTATNDTICPSGSTQLTATGATSYLWTPATGLSNATVFNPTASPTSTTTYSVIGTTGSCSDDVSITIVVDQPPVALFSYSPDPVACDNSPVQFDGSVSSNAASWTWTFENGTPAVSSQMSPQVTFQAGTNNAKLVVENTCNSKDSLTISVTIASSPSPDLGEDTTICLYTDLIIDAGSGYAAYSWTGASSVTNLLTVNSSSTGNQTYSVVVTDANGCQGSDDINVTFIVCGGAEEIASDAITIWPNPAGSYFNIEGVSGVAEIFLYSSAGQKMLNCEIRGNRQISLPSLQPGVYQVIVQTGTSRIVRKLIVGL